MSDYYTAVWNSVKGNPVDKGLFTIIDVTTNSRNEISEILSTVNSMSPSVIGLDVTNLWHEDMMADSMLVSVIQSIPNIVLPVEYHDNGRYDKEFLYSILLDRADNQEYGVVSFPNNRDIIRTYKPSFTVNGQTIEAFGCVVAKYCGADISNIIKKKKCLINYTSLKLSDENALPGSQLLKPDSLNYEFLTSSILDRIVLIGCTTDTHDQHLTPLGYSISGVMIHAHIINSILNNTNIGMTPLLIRYICCFLLAFVILLWYQKHKPSIKKVNKIWHKVLIYTLIFIVSLILCSVIGTYLFVHCHYYIDFAPYIVTLIISFLLRDKQFDFTKK